VDQNAARGTGRICARYAGTEIGHQIRDVAALNAVSPHSVRVERAFPSDAPGPGQYNCFMHALELEQPPRLVVAILLHTSSVIVGRRFVDFLVRNRVLDVTDSPMDGDVVVYSDDTGLRHAGKGSGAR
jgi:hypothetical protein